MSAANPDRLYNLLPAVYRSRDADAGYPMRGLLAVISEQVNLVDADIAQLYDNWFIETCQDWAVPYIGDLIGYTPVTAIGEGTIGGDRAEARERVLIPRSEVANTVRLRRRKGTMSALDELAATVSGWPSRALEFYRLLSFTQNINYLHLHRGRTIDIRRGAALDNLDSPFEHSAHHADLRSGEFYNLPGIGVYVWRLKAYTVTQAPALCLDEEGPNCFLFSVLGNNTQLYTHPVPATSYPPGKLNLPLPITRRALAERGGIVAYYGVENSFAIWLDNPRQLVPVEQIVAADLSAWSYRPLPGQVAIDPELGRIAFPPTLSRRSTVWVSYSYAFSTEIGGGEYTRTLSETAPYTLYLVGEDESLTHINDALKQWQSDAPKNGIIEITDSGVYVEPINITLNAGQTLQLRASSGRRPVIRLLNWQTSQPDDLSVAAQAADGQRPNTWFTLDGLTITGRGVQAQGDLTGLVIRHCTLVPGWGITCDCDPLRPMEASLEIDGAVGCVRIEHSIVGSIEVNRDESAEDPLHMIVSDSIVDATSADRVAIGAPEKLCAHANIQIRRTTVIGQVQARSIELATNSIFLGTIRVCRRQQGCMRFCYIAPGSRTGRRYECQPDLVTAAAQAQAKKDGLSAAVTAVLVAREQLRIVPQFNSLRCGNPTYCQLADDCATEISAGADDQSEMGAFHDLYQPQRAANLRTRLEEYTCADMTAAIRFAN